MPKQLPRKAAGLHQGGIDKLVEMARKDPELAQAAADAFDREPKRALLELFDLTERQRQAIENTPDDYIRTRAARVVEALKDPAKLKTLKIKFDPGPSPDSVVD